MGASLSSINARFDSLNDELMENIYGIWENKGEVSAAEFYYSLGAWLGHDTVDAFKEWLEEGSE